MKYNSPLQAHTLLQNVIFINLTLNEDEKVSFIHIYFYNMVPFACERLNNILSERF